MPDDYDTRREDIFEQVILNSVPLRVMAEKYHICQENVKRVAQQAFKRKKGFVLNNVNEMRIYCGACHRGYIGYNSEYRTYERVNG